MMTHFKKFKHIQIIYISLFVFFGASYVQAAKNEDYKSKYSQYILPKETDITHITVKYIEGTGIRVRNTHLSYQANDKLPPNISTADIQSEVNTIEALISHLKLTRTFVDTSEEKIDQMKETGETLSGKKLADLNLYTTISFQESVKYSSVEKLLDDLNKLTIVEFAYAQSEPKAASHLSTPNFEGSQGYLGAPPNGIDAQFAWTLNGGRGQGVKIIDIEGAWQTTHEDMPTLFSDSGNHINDIGWRNHGTAVLGVIGAKNNGFGVTGIANEAIIGVQSHRGSTGNNVSNAILLAANNVGPDGIILIELHGLGPSDGTPCTCNQTQCYFIAMEYWQENFDAIQIATANGVIVVEAAGNGSVNMDAGVFAGVFNRNIRDSGAIIVGASRSSQRSPMCFTNFGSRVDVNGWGENVVTMGYGSLFDGGHGEEDRFYTNSFGGTSSASPIVVGAAAIIQSVSNSLGQPALDSIAMRDVLASTGTLQSSGLSRPIGTFPNLSAAIDSLIIPPNEDDQLWLPAVLSILFN